jgi:DNA-binding MarR family transcriptional regulator
MSRVATAITELTLEVFRLNGELLAVGDMLVADLGLTSARWQVLGAIALSPVPLPIAHVARNMGLTRQAVQRIANEHVADGLLRFEPNPHHRRANLVLLTDKGERAYTAAIDRWQPAAAALGKAITPKEIATTTALLRTIRRRLEGDATKTGARHAVEKRA